MLTPLITTHPHISKHRVVLIDHADKMNASASNALLKNLEEPPANTLFLLISDRADKLAPTIRSRCSLVTFCAPELASGAAWLESQAQLSKEDVAAYMAIANNHPLQALYYYKNSVREVTQTLLKSVNGLWNHSVHVSQAAKDWQDIGAEAALDMLQKLSADLLKAKASDSELGLFFPIQRTWVAKTAARLDGQKLFALFDELGRMKRLISTTVDQQLVLESVGIRFKELPIQ